MIEMRFRRALLVLVLFVTANIVLSSIHFIFNDITMDSELTSYTPPELPWSPTTPPLRSLENGEEIETIKGIGTDAITILSGNKNGTMTDSTIEENIIISTADWNITESTIIISNITHTFEKDIEISNESDHVELDRLRAMGFNVTQSKLLKNVTVYLHAKNLIPGIDLQLFVFNYSSSSIAPNTSIYSEQVDLDSLGITQEYVGWIEIPLSNPVLLNINKTDNNQFFIVLGENESHSAEVRWGYCNDSGSFDGIDEGPAYFNDLGLEPNTTDWKTGLLDYMLNVTFLLQDLLPSSINLTINGTNVYDIAPGRGIWNSSEIKIGNPVIYDIAATYSSNTSIFYNILWNITLKNETRSKSSFEANVNKTTVVWNTSIYAIFPSELVNCQINVTLPPDWNVSELFNDSQSYLEWDDVTGNGKKFVLIHNAFNASWTIKCNSTNYISRVYTWKDGNPVTTVNSTDTVTFYANFSHKLTTGYANLTVFPINKANYNDSLDAITGNTSIQFSPWTIYETAIENPGEFRVQVSWNNGTAVGINITTLTVLSIPTNLTYLSHTDIIDVGESILVHVNFTNDYTKEPVTDATLLVKNSTDNMPWPNPFQITRVFLNGTYEIEIITLGLGFGPFFLSINMSKPLYLSSEISNITVTSSGDLANISLTASNCFGLRAINQSYAITDPVPYHNSTVKVSIYFFSNATLEPLRNAIITSSWIGGGPVISWVSAFFGYYNISIDVTGFHADTNHTLRILIQEEGYKAVKFYIIVPVRKLPTAIEPLTTSYAKYLEETFSVYTIFKDTFNDWSIPSVYELNGNVTIKLGNLVDNMSLLISGIGIYIYELTLSTLGLEEGNTYNITLSAFSSEHEFALINISLYVIPKAAVDLKLIGVPTYVLAGTQIRIFANLTLIDGTPIYSTPLIFIVRYEFQNTSQELQNTYLTNSSGIAESLIDVNPFMDSIQIKVEYQGNMTIQNKSISSTIIPIITLNSSLTLGPLPTEIVEGETLEISATLIINGTPAMNKTLTFKFIYDGEFTGDQRTAITGLTGTTVLSFTVPTGVTKIKVEVSYDGLSYETDNTTEAEIAVISIGALIWRYAYIWLPAILLTLAVVLGIYLNKRIIRLTKFQKEIRTVKERIFKKMRIGKVPQPTREALIAELFEKQISHVKVKKRKN